MDAFRFSVLSSRMKKTDAVKRDMARAMVEAGLSYREVADKLDISIGTVHNIVVDRADDPTPLARGLRRKFSARCMLMADEMLEQIRSYKITTSPLQQVIVSIAILLDKAAALEKEQTPHEKPSDPDENVSERLNTGDEK